MIILELRGRRILIRNREMIRAEMKTETTESANCQPKNAWVISAY